MKFPRDVSGSKLARALRCYGYETTRQAGSHMRLTSTLRGEEHHVTIPAHRALAVGTLAAIVRDVAALQRTRRTQSARTRDSCSRSQAASATVSCWHVVPDAAMSAELFSARQWSPAVVSSLVVAVRDDRPGDSRWPVRVHGGEYVARRLGTPSPPGTRGDAT